MNALFPLYDALVSINVPADKARAVVDAMERDMTTLLATKSDLASTQLLLKKDIDNFYMSLKKDLDNLRESTKKDIDTSRDKTIIHVGYMLAAAVGLLFTALKLTWPVP